MVDYFRTYRPADPASGQTYRLRNVSSGRYLDTADAGAVSLEAGSSYEDQHWILTERQTGYWTIDNVRTGRSHLDTDADGKVIWNTGWVGDDSLWSIQSVSGGFRLDNKYSGRGYLYGDGTTVGWNSGSADTNTVWALERV
ncbi:RICIN domain-containing protein [Streptomyces fimicarius]|uniref:RICIN domain-containing protein n=1 Tax=Streptomyces griseus TaxID=1911 RepID=UPI003674D6AA